MSKTTTDTTTPTKGSTMTDQNILTPDALADVSAALLADALRNYAGAETIETTELLPPVGVEHVTYRRGPVQIEKTSSTGALIASQHITVWVPKGVAQSQGRVPGSPHFTLGAVNREIKGVTLSDGTYVSSGRRSVAVFPRVPLIEERSEELPRSVFHDRHSMRTVTEVGPVEGNAENRHQRVKVSAVTRGSAQDLVREYEDLLTVAGRVVRVVHLDSWADAQGAGLRFTATPSSSRTVHLLEVTVQWREPEQDDAEQAQEVAA